MLICLCGSNGGLFSLLPPDLLGELGAVGRASAPIL